MSASKFACFLLATIGLSASAQTMQQPSLNITKDNRTIAISATGEAEAEPEVADINIGFTAYGATLPAAYKAGSETSNAIVKALLDAGAVKSEIQSESQRVSRLSDYEMKAQKGMKFSVVQSWKVSVAPNKAAEILDAAINAGANQSGDIVWRMKDNGALDLQAITKATERAHAMAAEMAKGMGITLGKPIYASNSVSSSVIRPRMMAMAMDKVAGAPAPLAIESQRVSSNATVDIVYAIE